MLICSVLDYNPRLDFPSCLVSFRVSELFWTPSFPWWASGLHQPYEHPGHSSPSFIRLALLSPTSIRQVGPFLRQFWPSTNHPVNKLSYLVIGRQLVWPSARPSTDRLISLSIFTQTFQALLKNLSISPTMGNFDVRIDSMLFFV